MVKVRRHFKLFIEFLCSSLVILYLTGIAYSIPDDKPYEYKLKKLILVGRHGQRTPIRDINPNLRDDAPLPGSRKHGQLMNEGREEAKAKGENYRKWLVDEEKYIHDYFDVNEWSIRGTGIERTIETAEYFLKGMFPGNSDKDRKICDHGTTDGNCEVIIPILSWNYTNDSYFVPWENCNTITKRWNEILSSLDYCQDGEMVENIGKCSDDTKKKIKSVFDSVASKLGMSHLDMTNLESAFDPLKAGNVTETQEKTNITDEERDIIRERYEAATVHRFTDDKNVTQLLGSGVIHYMVTDLEEVNDKFKDGDSDYAKISYYSAHDYTIMGFLASIGRCTSIPPFTSILEIAVREIPEKITNKPALYVNLSLNNDPILLPGNCDCFDDIIEGYQYCTIESVISYFKSVSISMNDLKKFDKNCDNTVPIWLKSHMQYLENVQKTKMSGGDIALLVVAIVLVLAAVATGLLLFCSPLVRRLSRPAAAKD